ncbi:hypothetical protein JW962_01480 [Candidatus Dojkabacteria bacterium]|nr:hypothetical protein [Candidatus Dojkabacteria bacterium]
MFKLAKRHNRLMKGFVFLIVGTLATITLAQLFIRPVEAAPFTVFSIRPSRIAVSQTDVNFLIKADAVTTATEDSVRVTFGTGFTVDTTASNVTVSTTDITSWDSACTNAWPGIGSAATGVSGQAVSFASGDLTVGQTYCFIITAGIDNPATAGNYSVGVETIASTVVQDSGVMILPIVDDVGGNPGDEVHITAEVGSFVRCSVTTTAGTDNDINLGTLTYGTVTTSGGADEIQIQGSTNAAQGMVWYYRSDAANNGLYSTTATDLLDGSDAERTISATTTSCSATTPCFGIYFNGTSSAGTGAFSPDATFNGGTVTTDVGPLTTAIYGTPIGNSGGAECSQVVAHYNVNATAAEDTVAATDYAEVLIFTCKADL